MMSVYETNLIPSDVFPGLSDLTAGLDTWNVQVCSKLPAYLYQLSRGAFCKSKSVREETAMMPESCSEVPDDSQKLFCLWGHSIMAEISSVINFGFQV